MTKWTCWKAGHRGRRGTSLIEIMVVVAIVLTLMSVMAWGVMTAFVGSKVSMTELQMKKVADHVQMYALRKRRPPSGLEEAFVAEDLPRDGWDRPFRYVAREGDFELISLGADGSEGGVGNDADIAWSELRKR
jgi:general secretion pathway protein G